MPPIGLLCVRLSCVHVLSIFCTLHTIYRCTCRTLTLKRLKTAIAMLPLTAPNLSCIARMATGAALFRVHSMHKWPRQMRPCSDCVLGTVRQLLAALASHLQMRSSNADAGYMRQHRAEHTSIEAEQLSLGGRRPTASMARVLESFWSRRDASRPPERDGEVQHGSKQRKPPQFGSVHPCAHPGRNGARLHAQACGETAERQRRDGKDLVRIIVNRGSR